MIFKGEYELMSIKIGINGFGRIGRLVFRAGLSALTWSLSASTTPV